jgi:dienelactone hydrolase
MKCCEFWIPSVQSLEPAENRLEVYRRRRVRQIDETQKGGRVVIAQAIVATILSMSIVAGAAATEMVEFKGKDKEIVRGRLTRPEGKGPFPAVILLHGCLGIDQHYNVWAKRLGSWGYVALQINSFGPQGKLSVCGPPSRRAQDLCDARYYLAALPYVDSGRIGLMGWSQGAAAALASFCSKLSAQKQKNPFRATIAFYPYCYKPLVEMNSPLLVLVGDRDDYCSAALWRERMPLRKTREDMIVKIYPGADHCFDAEGVDMEYMGHRLRCCPVASSDAVLQVRDFFARYLL